jgi:hypothetical protein
MVEMDHHGDMSIETWAAMVSLADDYRAKAAACAELAANTQDPPSKRVMERSAEQWNSLADSVEKYELTRK